MRRWAYDSQTNVQPEYLVNTRRTRAPYPSKDRIAGHRECSEKRCVMELQNLVICLELARGCGCGMLVSRIVGRFRRAERSERDAVRSVVPNTCLCWLRRLRLSSGRAASMLSECIRVVNHGARQSHEGNSRFLTSL